MNGTFVDSNVLIDVVSSDPIWSSWSSEQLKIAGDFGPLYINLIVYAEASTTFTTINEFELAVPPEIFVRLEIPLEAAFLAGKAFRQYRSLGGSKTSPLPDFFIGAHAEVTGLTLITRDAARYRTYFPHLALITP